MDTTGAEAQIDGATLFAALEGPLFHGAAKIRVDSANNCKLRTRS
jgi:hypothetical protein